MNNQHKDLKIHDPYVLMLGMFLLNIISDDKQ